MSLAQDVLSWIFLLAGSFFSIVGGIGILRLPEFFSRMHGGGITDTMGAGLIVVGLMFQAGFSLVAVKLLAILFFLMITSPSSCHALARSALAHGLQPVLDLPAKAVSSAKPGSSVKQGSSMTKGSPLKPERKSQP